VLAHTTCVNFWVQFEFDVLCAFECKVGYLTLKLGKLCYTSRWFDLLTFLGKCNKLLTRNKITKQRAFLIISSTPSLKNYDTNFKPLFLVELANFHHILYIYLKTLCTCSDVQPHADFSSIQILLACQASESSVN
jgi:hypothetical protein